MGGHFGPHPREAAKRPARAGDGSLRSCRRREHADVAPVEQSHRHHRLWPRCQAGTHTSPKYGRGNNDQLGASATHGISVCTAVFCIQQAPVVSCTPLPRGMALVLVKCGVRRVKKGVAPGEAMHGRRAIGIDAPCAPRHAAHFGPKRGQQKRYFSVVASSPCVEKTCLPEIRARR
jgi:hypothetical protein